MHTFIKCNPTLLVVADTDIELEAVHAAKPIFFCHKRKQEPCLDILILRLRNEEKQMHTFIKCNPTLLGYEFARETLDRMGYDYVAFGRFHFDDDLQYRIGCIFHMLDKIVNLFRLDPRKVGASKRRDVYVRKIAVPVIDRGRGKIVQRFSGKA